MPIKNTGRVISQEEISFILDFMDEHNIPLFDVLFQIALKKYVNGTLLIYNDTSLVLK